jgi:uncharacterized protein (TIGR03435 family)
MKRALISAIMTSGLLVGSSAACGQETPQAKEAAVVQTSAGVNSGVTFQPVRGAIRIDSTDVPFEVKIDPTALSSDSSSIEVGADHWEARGYDLKTLIAEIFEIDARLVDLPEDVAANGRFDVSLSLPTELDQDSMQRILVKALTQRFGVTIKPEARTMDVYVLSAPEGPASGLKRHVFARRRGGLAKLVSAGNDSNEEGGRITYMGQDCSGVNSGGITVQGSTLADFRRTLEPDLDRVIVDETKLGGSYDFKIGTYANQTQLFELMRVHLGLVVSPEQRRVTVLAVSPAETQPSRQLQAKL